MDINGVFSFDGDHCNMTLLLRREDRPVCFVAIFAAQQNVNFFLCVCVYVCVCTHDNYIAAGIL